MNSEISTLSEIIKRIKEERRLKYTTGFPSLDAIMQGGFSPKLYLLAADKGMGKTALMLSMIYYQTMRFQIPCAILTTKINQNFVFRLPLMFDHYPIHRVYTATAPNLNAMCRYIRDIMQKGVKVIYIDDLTVPFEGRTSELSSNEIIEFLRMLSCLTMEYQIAIVVLSDTDYCFDDEGYGRPNECHLCLPLEATEKIYNTIFIHRPEYYGITCDEYGIPTAGLAEIIIGSAVCNLCFDKSCARFLEKGEKERESDNITRRLFS